MAISLPDETTNRLIGSIRRYFSEQLDEDIGELRARLMFEFVLKEIGPSVYNAAISDAQTYLRDRVADLEGACYEQEFGYWPRGISRQVR